MQGIYIITNVITGNQYIGKTTDMRRRFWEHMSKGSLNMKTKLYREEFLKYGRESFVMEVLEEMEGCSDEEMYERERYWIAKLHPAYNYVGNGVPKSVRDKISESVKKDWMSKTEEEREKIIKNNLTGPRVGHEVKPETREKLRRANLGKSLYSVRVVETGKIYKSAAECAKDLGCCICSVRNQLNGRTSITKGYHLERVETIRDECSGVGRR